jgi:hypothetical protein
MNLHTLLAQRIEVSGPIKVSLIGVLPHQNLTRGFAQLAVVRIFRWSITRKLAKAMAPGSLPLAIRP